MTRDNSIASDALCNGEAHDDGPELVDPSEIQFTKYLEELGDPSSLEKPIGPIDCTEPERFVPFVSTLFRVSKRRIGVYTDHLCRLSGDIPLAGIKPNLPYWSAPPVIQSACEFLNHANARLDIIVRKQIDSRKGDGFCGSEFLSAIIANTERRGTIKIYACSSVQSRDIRLLTNAFIVADDRVGFRYEGDTDLMRGVGGLGDAEQNKDLFNGLDTMERVLEKAIALESTGRVKAPQPVKFVFEPGSNDPSNPTVVTPDISKRGIRIGDYFFDQKNCRPEPTSVLRTGLIFARELLIPKLTR